MGDITGDLWRRLGTSVVWDADALHAAASSGVTVSLRDALQWADTMPDEPPRGARTLVVTGLQTAVEVLQPVEVSELLRRTYKLVRAHGNAWGEAAIVFAVHDASRFRPSPGGSSLLLRLPGGGEIDLGGALWGGAAPDAQRIVEQRQDAKKRETTILLGYWLRRVS